MASTSASTFRHSLVRQLPRHRLTCAAASAAESTKRRGGRSEQGSSAGQQSGEQGTAEEIEQDPQEELEAYIREHGVDKVIEELRSSDLPRMDTEEFPVNGGRNPGYTPFEFITFTDELVEHTLSIQVDAPVSKVYRIWANRLNYNEWFDLIGQVVLHTEDPEYASYFLFYKWGQLPTLELYVTLMRTAVENEFIVERAVDGMDLSASAYFKEKEGGTEVSLRVAYLLPEPLRQYVGPVGVWGDVNDILQENLEMMKEFVEAVDADELDKLRAQDTLVMDQGVADTNKALDVLRQQLIEEGVKPGEGSPAARAEMETLLDELGINVDDYVDDYAPEEPPSQVQPEQPEPEAAAPAQSAADEGKRRPSRGQSTDARSAPPRGAKPGAEAAEARKRRGPQPSSAITKEALLAFSGRTQAEAARAFGVSASTISKYAREYGINWRKPGAGYKKTGDNKHKEGEAPNDNQ